MITVRQFVDDAYQLISASSPTVPLQGSDLSKGIQILNRLLKSFSATGLMTPIAVTTSVTLTIGQQEVVTGSSTYTPTPDITLGRLSNIEECWLLLSGVTYPLVQVAREEFNSAWKYDPLQGLPRFVIAFPQTEITTLRIYPAPSQVFEFFVRGKFQLGELTSNDDMSLIPEYMQLYLTYALARQLAPFKGRANAWTAALETLYKELRDDISNASEVNVAIVGERDSLLNGAWRVRAGV